MGSSGSTHWVGSRRSGCSFQQQQQQQQEASRYEDCRAIEFQIGHWPKFTNWNHNGCSGLRWQETQRSSPNTLKSNRLVTFQRGKQPVFFLFSPIVNTTAISLSYLVHNFSCIWCKFYIEDLIYLAHASGQTCNFYIEDLIPFTWWHFKEHCNQEFLAC